jgi:hypothetical protein
MNSLHNDIKLIVLGSIKFNESVHGALVHIGTTVTAIHPNNWLETQPSDQTHMVVLALERHDYSIHRILAAIYGLDSTYHNLIRLSEIDSCGLK